MSISHTIRSECTRSLRIEINRTKIKGGCQSGPKVVTHNSKSDLPLVYQIQSFFFSQGKDKGQTFYFNIFFFHIQLGAIF